jgi:hypothetical protein
VNRSVLTLMVEYFARMRSGGVVPEGTEEVEDPYG